jgi:hypothetical protein
MSAITTTFNNRTRRAYLSMGAFNADIYSYTTSLDPTTYQTTGALGAVTGATASNCPIGRFLYENGKKLFPGVHPGVSTYMIGVFDPVSFLNGFIDPNSEEFTLMNTDKPVDLASSTNTFGTNPTTSVSDLAQPVFTRGDILAGGNGDISGTLVVGGATTITNGALTVTNGAVNVTNGALTVTNGKLNLDAVATNAIVGTATLAIGTVTVATTAVTAASIILASHKVVSGTQGILRTDTITAGVSFTIESSSATDTSSVNWLVIN